MAWALKATLPGALTALIWAGRVPPHAETRAFSDQCGSYPEFAKKFAHSAGGKSSMASAIAAHRSSMVRAPTLRRIALTDIPHIPSKFVEIVPLSHRQGNCIPYAAIRWHDFGNRPALGRPLGHFSRHPDTPLLSLSPRRRFPRPTPERVFVADHQSSSGFSGTGPSAPPPQPIGMAYPLQSSDGQRSKSALRT